MQKQIQLEIITFRVRNWTQLLKAAAGTGLEGGTVQLQITVSVMPGVEHNRDVCAPNPQPRQALPNPRGSQHSPTVPNAPVPSPAEHGRPYCAWEQRFLEKLGKPS